MQTKTNVLLVDDQPRARNSLKALLSTLPGVDQIYEAGDGQEAVRLVQRFVPQIVLMDIRMPVLDGLEATRQIKAGWPRVRVIVLSMYTDRAEEALAAGADVFISKGEPAERLLNILNIS